VGVGRVTLLFLLGSVAGCGGKTREAPSPDIPIRDAASVLARAVCTNAGSCCAYMKRSVDVATCEQTLEKDFAAELAQLDDTFLLPGACVDSLTQITRKCALTDTTHWKGCDLSSLGMDPQRGRLGDICYIMCDDPISVDCYTTVGSTDAGPPMRCYRSDGLYCDDATRRCARLAALGASCDFPTECQSGFCSSGKCATSGSNDVLCFGDAVCRPELVCDGTRCVQPAPLGASCSLPCQSGACFADSTSNSGKCGPSPLVAAFCQR
jgi:hypothetical protein